MPELRTSPDVRIGLSPADRKDPFLRRFQRLFDTERFDNYEWPLILAGHEFNHAKVAHVGAHVGKLLGKVSRLERVMRGERSTEDFTTASRQVYNQAFPDALIYRTQLSNTMRFDLHKRLGGAGTDSTSLPDVRDLLIDARDVVDTFTEQLEHGRYVSQYYAAVRETAIPALHFSGLIMANIFETEPRVAHGNRLVSMLRSSI